MARVKNTINGKHYEGMNNVYVAYLPDEITNKVTKKVGIVARTKEEAEAIFEQHFSHIDRKIVMDIACYSDMGDWLRAGEAFYRKIENMPLVGPKKSSTEKVSRSPNGSPKKPKVDKVEKAIASLNKKANRKTLRKLMLFKLYVNDDPMVAEPKSKLLSIINSGKCPHDWDDFEKMAGGTYSAEFEALVATYKTGKTGRRGRKSKTEKGN